jgi:uncharacterized protein
MGLIHLDASVVLPLLVADAHTARVVTWFANVDRSLVISDLANLEVSAVLSRELRKGRLTRAAMEAALAGFDAMRADCERLHHGVADFLLAQRLARDVSTKLAAADALHLASAKNAAAALATFDDRLAEAARAQGLEVVEVG